MRLVLAALALGSAAAQSGPTPGDLLAGIRQQIRQNLTRLPDYTCRLTIQRSTGREGARRLHLLDTIHIEVGYLDGKELYAWPGQKFENAKLEDLLPAGGTVGTGDFALHIKGIFLTEGTKFTYAGHSVLEGRDTVRFQYLVPRSKSRYVLRTGPRREAVVSYRGSFWADARTLLLQRLEVLLDDIPHEIRVRRGGSILTYSLTRIGETDFLLPHSSELFIVGDTGTESRNLTLFENCHQYSGESVVSFVDPATVSAEAPKPVTEAHIPAGVLVELSLGDSLDGRHLAIGDPIAAVVSHDSAKAGAVIIPKGARVTGRVTYIGQTTRGRVVYQVLGLQLSTIEFAERKAHFAGSLESVHLAAAQTEIGRGSQSGETLLFIKANSLLIPAGAHMLWRTRASE